MVLNGAVQLFVVVLTRTRGISFVRHYDLKYAFEFPRDRDCLICKVDEHVMTVLRYLVVNPREILMRWFLHATFVRDESVRREFPEKLIDSRGIFVVCRQNKH